MCLRQINVLSLSRHRVTPGETPRTLYPVNIDDVSLTAETGQVFLVRQTSSPQCVSGDFSFLWES